MKKWLTLLMTLVLVTIMLGACSEESSKGAKVPEGATEVVLWNLFGGGDADYFQEVVDKYNDSQTDIFVNNIMQENAEYYTKLLTSIGAGKGPDVAIAHTHVIPELVSQGLITELDSFTSNWEGFNQNILDATVYDGLHYAIPLDTHAQIMYINNKLVAEAGLLNDDGSIKMEETPEGFIDFFSILKEKLPKDKIPLAFSNNGSDPYWMWWAFYTQMGGEAILTDDIDNPKYALDLDKAIKAADYIKDLYQEHKVIPLNLADFYSDFQTGNAAAMSTGVWATGIWESTDGLDFTPIATPTIFEKEGAWGDSHTLVLPYYNKADQEVQKAAVEFMEFAADNGAIWAKAGHIPSKTTVIESDEFNKLPYRSNYAEVANYVNFADRTIYARGVQDIVIRNLDLLWAGDATAEDVFSTVEKEVKDLIGE
ncbi:extracellular solute-binding protein [Sporosarcina psychrophila]|uniref:extracellular solute-binding protein n=1 Tax=Sporosarcina psychrophila TaxID=1476 RepID=UPI00078CE47F|nr:extracellular solute-binding protein [Sporosarcina psychrophila]AMQ06232.1 sugar transporter [Sporosarcina psychrophila]